MHIFRLAQTDPLYPANLPTSLRGRAPETIAALGNLEVLKQKFLALFCSVKCPGSLILQTYDIAQQLRQAALAVVGGFHSPMERECLAVLLRGPQSVVICPARSIEEMRIPAVYQQPLADGRLLLLSPFDEKERRVTAELAIQRNRFVAALADWVFVAHAQPGSRTEDLCHEILTWEKPLYTLDDTANANLFRLGAVPFRPHEVSLRAPVSAEPDSGNRLG